MSNDERLRVEALVARDLSGLRLAVLSACESATPSTHLPEAAISHPAALQYAGAGGVLGTLWEADDAATAILMAAFYRSLAQQTNAPANPARALRMARQWVRDSTNAGKAGAFPDLIRQPGNNLRGRPRALARREDDLGGVGRFCLQRSVIAAGRTEPSDPAAYELPSHM